MLTNCSIAHMVEHEMKCAGKLILTLLRRDDPEALKRFVDKHKILLFSIEEKQRTVQDAIHVDDLKIEYNNLIRVQNALPMIQEKVHNVHNKGRVNVEGDDLAITMHSLICWYEHAIETLIWVILHPNKVSHMKHALGTMVRSIREKGMLPGITADQRQDLAIMEDDMTLLYSFVSELQEKSYQGRKSKSRYRKMRRSKK